MFHIFLSYNKFSTDFLKLNQNLRFVIALFFHKEIFGQLIEKELFGVILKKRAICSSNLLPNYQCSPI